MFSLTLSYDWIRHLLRPKPTRSQEKMDSSDRLPATTARYGPLSTRTLGFQALLLSFLSVWIFAVLIPSTLFSRTRSAHLTVTGFDVVPEVSLDIVTKYWDYGFCECTSFNPKQKPINTNRSVYTIKVRCLAAAPWFSLIFSLPTSIVTWVAWNVAH